MNIFGNRVDNSKLTPEFHNQGQGQGQETSADNNQVQGNVDNNQSAPVQNNGQTDMNIDNNQQDNTQQVDNGQEGIVVGDETFATQDDLLKAYEEMKENYINRDNSYKNLQREYTKARQEISMRNKMAVPNNNRMNMAQMPMGMPMGMGNQMPYRNIGVRPGMPNTMPNMNYNPYLEQQRLYEQQYQNMQSNQVVNETMINMAAENKIIELKQQDPNFDEVAGELWNIMDNDSYFANIKFTDPEMARNAIGAAYQMAKQKVESAKANIKINNAKVEAYNNKQQKLINNDVSNVANKNKNQPQKTDSQKIKESIIGAKPQVF